MKSSILETIAKRLLLLASVAAVATSACVSEDPGVTAKAPSCDDYCNLVMKSCDGQNKQYAERAHCMTMCGLLPTGTLADGNVNSVGCRQNKAGVANDLESCRNAGPYGNEVCGTRCESFCTIAATYCLDQQRPPFAETGLCIEQCSKANPADNTLKFDATKYFGPVQDPGGDTLNCRMHHLHLAMAGKVTHCPHLGVPSETCR